MVEEQAVTSVNGKRIPMQFDTICVHGDNPSATAIARDVREGLVAQGVSGAADDGVFGLNGDRERNGWPRSFSPAATPRSPSSSATGSIAI